MTVLLNCLKLFFFRSELEWKFCCFNRNSVSQNPLPVLFCNPNLVSTVALSTVCVHVYFDLLINDQLASVV